MKETGKLDNTIMIFLSDNGASPEVCANFGPGFDRPGKIRDGRRISYPFNKDVMPGPETSYGSIGERWANVANTPYRYAKAESFEGGVRTPFIAFWPKGIKASKGSITKHQGVVMDLMSTFVQVSGAKYPSSFNGHVVTPTNGSSIVPAFSGNNTNNMATFYNEHFTARYIKTTDWKLVSTARDTSWHLYRSHSDESEVNDLASRYPEIVKQLSEDWRSWANKNKVFHKAAPAR